MAIRVGTEADPEPMVDINTTPLVDVLLVLLVMLIITIPIQLQAVNLEMPGRQRRRRRQPPVVVQLDIDAAGRFLWNGEPLADRPRWKPGCAKRRTRRTRPRSTCDPTAARSTRPSLRRSPARSAKGW